MYRSLTVSLTAALLALVMTTSVAAQGRGYHRGGAIFRAAPPVAAPGPAFNGRPVAPGFGPGVHAGPFGFGPSVHGAPFGSARYPRTIIVPPVVGYYSPYGW